MNPAVVALSSRKNSTTVRAKKSRVTTLGRWLSRLAPGLAYRVARHMFFRPPRHPHPEHERPWLDAARQYRLLTLGLPHPAWDYQALRVYAWGEARVGRVMFLHGWGGRATQFSAFIPAFLEAGYEVLAVDAPGHGLSAGHSASLPQFANALERAVRQFGPVDAIIAHSFGGAATGWAAREGLAFGKAILIAPPSDLGDYLDALASALGLNRSIKERLRRYVETLLGRGFEDVRADRGLAGLSQSALVIHDEDDGEVPLRAGQAVADAWPGARLLVTRGLGHRRILKSPEVVAKTLAFVQGHPV